MSGFAEGTPTVTITLGGKSYELGFNWGAKRRVRDYLTKAGKTELNTHQEDYLAATVWASMDKETRSTLTVDDVAEWINPRNERKIAQKIEQLVTDAEPEEDAEEKNGQPVAVKMPTTGDSQSNSVGPLVSTTSG